MRRSRRPIIIASRRSRLARLQAQQIGQALGRLHPRVAVEYRWIESEGDQACDVALADANADGGKGLFARAIERALLSREAHLAVHSLKDLPTQLTSGLTLAAIPRREDVRDCLIAPNASSIDELPKGAVLGTAGPRRAAQVKRLRPDIRIELIRGNIETRLSKVIDSAADGSPGGPTARYDATLLAMAGLKRSSLGEHATKPIDPELLLPAAGQGALAVQCRRDDHVTLTRCLPLNDSVAAAAVHAERQIIAELGGDCHSPIGVLVQPIDDNQQWRVRARVLSPDGSQMAHSDHTAPVKQIKHLIRQVLAELRQQGCELILGT